jgi:hypothetical protein
VYEKSGGVAQDRNAKQLPFISIGSVQHRSPQELDAAIIKLHLTKRNGIERYLLNPANSLKPSIKLCTARHQTRNADLPPALTGLLLSTNEEIMRKFGQGSTQYLMKYGEKTLTLHDGKISVCIVPIHGGTTFPEESLVEPGASSAPVLIKTGSSMGMCLPGLSHPKWASCLCGGKRRSGHGRRVIISLWLN